MYLKRVAIFDDDGNPTGKYSHCESMRKDGSFGDKWNPTPRFIAMGLSEGWLEEGTMKGGVKTFTFKTQDGADDVTYKVIRPPMTQEEIKAAPPGPVLRANQYLCEKV